MKSPEDMSREDLIEEVVFLRSELGLQQLASRTSALTAAFGLTAMEAHLTAALYGAKGRPLSVLVLHEHILTFQGRRDGGDNLDAVSVYVCRIRKKLGLLAVETIRVKGYALTPMGLEKVAPVIEGAAR